jgi:hypothetical protein
MSEDSVIDIRHLGKADVVELAMTGAPVPSELEQFRQRLVLALDVDDSVLAMRWAARMQPWFGVAKVGLELFSAAGPPVVAELMEAGFRVFVDLKVLDIPTTTRKAARVLGALGASYLTVHASAGTATMAAGAEGLAEGAARAGLPAPAVLAVTVLTCCVPGSRQPARRVAGASSVPLRTSVRPRPLPPACLRWCRGSGPQAPVATTTAARRRLARLSSLGRTCWSSGERSHPRRIPKRRPPRSSKS